MRPRHHRMFVALLVALALAAPGLATEPAAGGEKVVETERRAVWMGKEPTEGDGEEHHVKVLDLSGEGALPHAVRGYLGVALTAMTPELRSHFGAPEQAGVMISRVEAGSPAEAAGLRVGDILTAVDGATVSSPRDVQRAVRRLEEGDTVALELVRDARPESLSATVTEREVAQLDVGRLVDFGEDARKIMVRFDDEAISESMESLSEVLSSPELQEQIRSIRRVGGGYGERLERLEERIEELERQLESRER